jgi:hypothetical protein
MITIFSIMENHISISATIKWIIYWKQNEFGTAVVQISLYTVCQMVWRFHMRKFKFEHWNERDKEWQRPRQPKVLNSVCLQTPRINWFKLRVECKKLLSIQLAYWLQSSVNWRKFHVASQFPSKSNAFQLHAKMHYIRRLAPVFLLSIYARIDGTQLLHSYNQFAENEFTHPFKMWIGSDIATNE